MKLKQDFIPEWHKAYINYELLVSVLSPFKEATRMITPRNLLSQILNNSNVIENQNVLNITNIPEQVQSKIQLLEEEFISLLQEEIRKSDSFYSLQLEILNHQFSQIYEVEDEMRHNLQILYKKAQFLKQFKEVNLKLANKLIYRYRCNTLFLDNSARYLSEFLQQLSFFNDAFLKKTIINIKSLYKDNYDTIKDLQNQKYKHFQSNKFKQGFNIGIAIFLIICFIYQRINMIFLDMNKDHQIYITFITQGILLLYLLLFVFTLHILRENCINYQLLFNTKHVSGSIFTIVSILGMIYLLLVNIILSEEQEEFAQNKNLIYFNPFGDLLIIDAIYGSYILWGVMALILFLPLKYLNYQARLYFLTLQVKTLLGMQLSKEIIWNCDQWISFSLFFKLIYQNEFNQGAWIITCIPTLYRLYYAIRLNFKMRNQIMAIIKYFLLLLFLILSQLEYFNIYINLIIIIILSLFFGYYDYIYDWDINRQIRRFANNFYILAGIVNISLYFVQLITLVLDVRYDNLLFILGGFEIVRRFIWNLIYFEKEHAQNEGAFKAVPDILIDKNHPLLIEQRNLFGRLDIQWVRDSQIREKANSLQIVIRKIDEQNSLNEPLL